MSTILEELRKANPEKEVIAITVYFINGVLFVPKAYLTRHMGVSGRTVSTWQNMGLKISEYSLPKLNLYDLKYVIEWYRFNVDQKHARRRKGK